ncbi:MAG TPA: hypothetical protein VGD39_09685 [Nocardioides sp.]
MSERPIVPCRVCLAPVIWATDAAINETLAVDALPVYGGNVALEISANTFPIAHRGTMAHTFAHNRTDLHTAHKATCAGSWPRVQPHAFAVDDRIPADWCGRRWCICGVPGIPGDDRHPEDAPPLRPPTDQAVVQEAARARDAAILGEREDDADLLALARRIFQQVDPPDGLADRALSELQRRDTAS